MKKFVGTELVITERDLPHWQLGGSAYFITFRVHSKDAIPLLNARERAEVMRAILYSHEKTWRVHALTVMPDHVHILATPVEAHLGAWYPLARILHSVKRNSARRINALRSTRGQVWQHESFDRIIRDAQEFREKARYILRNSVKAGLVDDGWLYDGFWWDSDGG